MPSRLSYLDVTFREDVDVGPVVFLTGERLSLPEPMARGLGPKVAINGAGTVSDAPAMSSRVSGSIVVDAVASLSSTLKLTDWQTIVARGRSAAGDCGDGTFTYSASSAATVDGGIVFAGPGNVGRLFRQGYTVLGFNGAVDARWYGVTADYQSTTSVGTDNAAALALISTSLNAGSIRAVQFPRGAMYTTAGLPTLTKPVALRGYGGEVTRFYIAPSMSGDMISISDVWYNSEYNEIEVPSIGSKPGFRLEGIGVVGIGGGANRQNALAMYDRCDAFQVWDFSADNLTGSGITTGYTKNTALAYIREGAFGKIRIRSCGQLGWPAGQGVTSFEFHSDGTGDGTNQVDIFDARVVFPYGVGLQFHNANTNSGIRNINVYGLMVHGEQNPTSPVLANLIEIGSTTKAGNISSMRLSGVSANACYVGYSALAFLAASGASEPYGIQIDGSITSGNGGGINVQYGRQIQINFTNVAVTQVPLTVGPNVGGEVMLSGWPWEKQATNVIDASVTKYVSLPVKQYGAPLGNRYVSADVPDNAITGGNARGSNAVDLQTSRGTATQVASSTNSTVGGGTNNTANATNATVNGGNTNVASGPSSMIPGGFNNTADGDTSSAAGRQSHTRGRYGAAVQSSGRFAANGDAQRCTIVLRRQSTSATPVVLTADGAAPGFANLNNFTAVDQCQAISGTVLAYCPTTDEAAMWSFTALIKRPSNAASTTLVGTPTVTKLYGDAGTSAWGGPAITADTTNSGVSIACTGAAATSINWVGELRGPETMG